MEGEQVIRLRGVSFTYRDGERPALRGIDLSVRRGELIVVMGATGAGKTTLAKLLNGAIPGFQPGQLDGEVEVMGHQVAEVGVAGLAGVIGLVSQDFEAQLFATNVRQEVAFGMEQLGVPRDVMRQRLDEVLRLVGLVGFEERDPATLSGGEKQRLAIAATLALEPQILVFDEPTTDLDPLGKEEIFDVLAALRRTGTTIVLIEHEIAAAERADRLVLMSAGQIVADAPPAQLLPDVERLDAAGVRAADLDRLGRAVGVAARFDSLAAAENALRPRLRAVTAPSAPQRLSDEVLLNVEQVRYDYGNGGAALGGVSLAVRRGEFIAIIGQNGSGKTTLAKHLNGLLHPGAGRVCLRGEDMRQLPLNRIAADVGYVFQNPDHQIFAASVGEEVTFALRNFGIDAAETARRAGRALEAVGLSGMEASDPFVFAKGQRQRLAVASLLALQPCVLILDEPTTGLDYTEQRRMMDLLRTLHRDGMTLVVITHSPWVVAEYAERGVLMRGGQVAFDGPLRALFAEEDLLAACHFRVPDVTRLGRRLGFTPLTLDELTAAFSPP